MTTDEILNQIINNEGKCGGIHCEDCPLASKVDGMCRRPFIQAEGYEVWQAQKLELAKKMKDGYAPDTFTIEATVRCDILSVCAYIISTEHRDYINMLEEHQGNHEELTEHPYADALRVTEAFKNIKEN